MPDPASHARRVQRCAGAVNRGRPRAGHTLSVPWAPPGLGSCAPSRVIDLEWEHGRRPAWPWSVLQA
eukprot:5190515-Alexandrium_andersonii.AAC.1